jgi:carbon monoxide dehydrogenase subunit G
MQITEIFMVDRPIADVWTLFNDVPEVARCLPGAALNADHGNGTYTGTLAVKLGPISSSFTGDATVTADHDEFRMKIVGKGVDRSGGSQGRVTVAVSLTPAASGTSVGSDAASTSVTMDADVTLAGPIAQFGRTGLVAEVSKRLINEFAECLHAKLSARTVEESSAIQAGDVRGFGLLVASVLAWLKNLFRNSPESTE